MKQLLCKVRQLLHTDLVKISFYNGLGTFVKMFSGVVSVKVVASIVGPSGMALLGQLINFTTIIQSLAGGGITTGVTRYISEHSADKIKSALYVGTALRITLVLSFFTGLILISFGRFFSRWLLNVSDYAIIFQVFGGSIILYALNALLMAILNGFKEFRFFIQINIAGSLISLLFSVLLALTWGLKGAMLSVVTYQSIVFIVAIYMLLRSNWPHFTLLSSVFNGSVALHLFRYSLMALASALIVPLSQLLVRGYIVEHISAAEAGMWEGINRISGMYLQIVITSLGVYYLPRLAELKTDQEFSREVKSVFQVMIPFLMLAAFTIYVFRSTIISLLFSKEFIPMESLFPFQLVGDIFKMSGWILGYMMVAKAMVRTYIITELINYSLFVFLSYILVNKIGVNGAVIAYATGHVIYFLIMLRIFRKIVFSFNA